MQLTWELVKYEIRKFSRSFSKDKSRRRRKKEINLFKELNESEILLGNMPDKENELSYLHTKERVELLEKEKTDCIIFRSKVKWYEEGEKRTQSIF